MTLSINIMNDDNAHDRRPRAFGSHVPKWQRFQTDLLVVSQESAAASTKKATVYPYQRQYAHVYHERLAVLGPKCWENVNNDDCVTTSTAIKVQRILELKELVLSVVVGTVVKECGSDKDRLLPGSSNDNTCSTSDAVYLEDESGRVELQCDTMHQLCTGLVIAVLGTVGTDGVMTVEKIFKPQTPLPCPVPMDNSDDGACVLLVSGLNCGSASSSSLPRDMLLSYLEGRFGVSSASSICRVILAGGLVAKDNAVQAVRELDGFCCSVAAAGIPLDVLPGKDDPTTANWPQRPINRALLPVSDRFFHNIMYRTPNPYAAQHADKLVIGTDGTNVHDLMRRVLLPTSDGSGEPSSFRLLSELEALQMTLQYSHFCPTGPDSVPTLPHAERDPMVLEQLPNIYFAGNCTQFATGKDILQNSACRLICLPQFSETGQAVLVHLDSLEVEILRFEVS